MRHETGAEVRRSTRPHFFDYTRAVPGRALLRWKKTMLVAPLKWRGSISALRDETRPLDGNIRVWRTFDSRQTEQKCAHFGGGRWGCPWTVDISIHWKVPYQAIFTLVHFFLTIICVSSLKSFTSFSGSTFQKVLKPLKKQPFVTPLDSLVPVSSVFSAFFH